MTRMLEALRRIDVQPAPPGLALPRVAIPESPRSPNPPEHLGTSDRAGSPPVRTAEAAAFPISPTKTEPPAAPHPSSRRRARQGKSHAEALAAQYEMIAGRIIDHIPLGSPTAVAFAVTHAGPEPGGLLAPLAVALAERASGATVAIDADFSRPTLAQRLGVLPGRRKCGNLLDVLRTGSGWREAIRPTGVERLDVLPGGRPPQGLCGPTGLERFGWLLEELRARHPLILVSLGPLVYPGVAALARLCDGTCLFVALGRTGRREARDAVRQIRSHDGRVLGCVVVE